jgi:hypothetical protein
MVTVSARPAQVPASFGSPGNASPIPDAASAATNLQLQAAILAMSEQAAQQQQQQQQQQQPAPQLGVAGGGVRPRRASIDIGASAESMRLASWANAQAALVGTGGGAPGMLQPDMGALAHQQQQQQGSPAAGRQRRHSYAAAGALPLHPLLLLQQQQQQQQQAAAVAQQQQQQAAAAQQQLHLQQQVQVAQAVVAQHAAEQAAQRQRRTSIEFLQGAAPSVLLGTMPFALQAIPQQSQLPMSMPMPMPSMPTQRVFTAPVAEAQPRVRRHSWCPSVSQAQQHANLLASGFCSNRSSFDNPSSNPGSPPGSRLDVLPEVPVYGGLPAGVAPDASMFNALLAEGAVNLQHRQQAAQQHQHQADAVLLQQLMAEQAADVAAQQAALAAAVPDVMGGPADQMDMAELSQLLAKTGLAPTPQNAALLRQVAGAGHAGGEFSRRAGRGGAGGRVAVMRSGG